MPPTPDESVPVADLTPTSMIDYGGGTDTPRPGQSLHEVLPTIRGYDLLSVIGSGGMGVVLKARHLELQRLVAIKMLRGVCLADEEFRERFQVEAEAIARLQHPNIIQVFAVGTVEPRPGEVHPPPYLSLEYIEGGNLEQHVETPQSPQFAARIVEKVARAVQVAHQVGVIHRDLKPANVLLTREGEPKIADFGLAKQLEGEQNARKVTQDGTVVGTPQYMAPEQIVGDPATPAMDIYALGVILYELLAGRLPFHGATVVETVHQVMYLDPVAPRRLQPSVPRDLETICLKCLSKDPAKRYASAEALADDLACWIAGRPILARPVGPVEAGVRWARRNPSLAAVSLLLVFVALVGFLGVLWKWREAEANAVEASLAAEQAKQRTEAERWKHYRANIVAASSALQVHNVTAARTLLDTAPEEHRNWEWHHFRQQLDRSQFALPAPESGLDYVEIAKQGHRAVLLGHDQSAYLWDTQTRPTPRALPPTPELHPFNPNSDLTRFASIAADHSVTLHDLDTGRKLRTLRGHTAALHNASFTPDGQRFLTVSNDGTARVWDLASGKELLVYREHKALPYVFAISGDGRRVVTSDAGSSFARVWDVATGRTLSIVEATGMTFHWGNISRTGDRLLAVKGYPEYHVRVWDTTTGQQLCRLEGHTNMPTGYEFSPDGSEIATSSFDQTVRIWDTKTGRMIHNLKGHRGQVYTVLYSPDGSRVITCGEDRTVRIWNPKTGDALAVLHGHTREIKKLAITADGTTIVSVGNGEAVRLWDVRRAETSDTLRGHTDYVYQAAFHPDGERVASVAWDGKAIVWNATTSEKLATFDHGEKNILSSVAFHPDGQRLATVARDGFVRIWDLATEKVVDRWDITAGSFKDPRLVFRPAGDLLASGCMDGTVRVWNLVTQKKTVLRHGVTDAVRDVAFSPDGRWLASAGDSSERTVRIWDAETLECVQVLEGHTDGLYCLAFRPDGRVLASGSRDGTVRLWDTQTWTLITVLKLSSNVYGLSYTGDGSRLACACADNTIRLWDTARHEEVGQLGGHNSYAHSVAFSPDSTRLVSGSGDFTVRIWDTLSAQERAAKRKVNPFNSSQ